MSHRPHDYRHLVQRWRQLAARAGLRMRKLVNEGQFDLYSVESPAAAAEGGIYLSAAIHGDEPAASEALITWAENNARKLRRIPLLMFPCLNPWGLVNNCRYDREGRDLNRLFHSEDVPVLKALRERIAGRRFALALQLHEDYDGQGYYLYEVQRVSPHWGEELLEAASREIPIEPRVRVDGRKFRAGLMRRRMEHRRFERIGYPEAVWLHLHHAFRTFTVESPSEFSLEQRVRAHVAVIDTAVRKVMNANSGELV